MVPAIWRKVLPRSSVEATVKLEVIVSSSKLHQSLRFIISEFNFNPLRVNDREGE
jgi:hypothetical protein